VIVVNKLCFSMLIYLCIISNLKILTALQPTTEHDWGCGLVATDIISDQNIIICWNDYLLFSITLKQFIVISAYKITYIKIIFL